MTAAGASAQTRGVTPTEVVFGMHTDLSGVAATYGVSSSNGVKMRFDEINEAGGINGRKLKVIVEDQGYQVPKAVQACNKLINRDKVFAFVAPLGTPMNNACFKDQFAAGVPNLFPLSAARSMYEPFERLKFYGAASYVDQIRAGIEYFVKTKGKKAICVMYQDTDFGKEILEGAELQTKKLGIKLVETAAHKPTDQDFTASITKLRAAGCDLIAMGTIVRDSIVPYTTARKAGWTDVDFLGSAAVYDLVVGAAPGMDGFYGMGLTEMPYVDSHVAVGQGLRRGLQEEVQRRSEHRRGLRLRRRRPHLPGPEERRQGPDARQLREGHGSHQGLPRHLQRPRGQFRPQHPAGRELLVPRRGQGRPLDPRHRAARLLETYPGNA